jgi:hypothetical protein
MEVIPVGRLRSTDDQERRSVFRGPSLRAGLSINIPYGILIFSLFNLLNKKSFQGVKDADTFRRLKSWDDEAFKRFPLQLHVFHQDLFLLFDGMKIAVKKDMMQRQPQHENCLRRGAGHIKAFGAVTYARNAPDEGIT